MKNPVSMRFQVLGPLEVATSAGPLAIRAKRPRALLAILLLNATEVVSISRIIDGMWPEQPPRSALENVRTYVFQLRSLLAKADAGAAGKARLESHPAGYRLQTDGEELDLIRFDTLATNGSRALRSGDYASAALLLGEALDLWKGAPLPELVLGPAIRAKIVALEEWRWQVEADQIRARLALGHRAELVPQMRELISERPLDENLRCLLMTALHEMGRTGEALATFADARRTLVRELGIDPGPELRRTQAAILSGDEIRVVPPAAPTFTPPVPDVLRHLPATRADLVARESAVDALTSLGRGSAASPSQGALVGLVTGPPGIGKTAVAVAAATRLDKEFPHGQLFADLRGSTDRPRSVDEAVSGLLSELGVVPGSAAERSDQRLTLYRALMAGRRTVLVLDDAADPAQVQPLIPPGQSLVLVTSRRLLASVECDVRLEPKLLSETDGLRLLRAILGEERVGAEPVAARSILRACGGLPAAIRIAGARLAALPGHPLQYLADRLAERDRVLEELSLDGLSLSDSFDTSYTGLDDGARRCFRALGMSDPSSITTEDLSGPLALSERNADRQLEQLVHEGLLRPEQADRGRPQYCMPTMLHAYARSRLFIEGADERPHGADARRAGRQTGNA